MFPKKAFITFATENYSTLVDKLIESILLFSNYPIIVYGYNFDYKFENPRVFSKRLNDTNLNLPEFEKVKDISGHMGIVNRADKNTYYTLSRKPVVLLDSINDGLEEGVFLDADGLARHNIDELFSFSPDCSNYPLIGRGLFEYMMLYGKGDPAVGNPLEFPMMNLLGIRERTLFYGQTNVIFFNKNCKEFFEECVTVANNKNIIRHNLLYAPYHDETIMNVLLWKRRANRQLPLVHFNLSDFNSLKKFEQSEPGIHMDNCAWHQIPANKNDIKFFHGCKSVAELDKCLNYFSGDKSDIAFPKIFKSEKHKNSKKIAIVTLFDKNYEQLAKMSIPNKLDYANKHGYDFIYFDKVIDPSRPPQWSKVKAIEYALQDYDWVWWIDIDALIMEFDVKLESIIDENYDIIFTANKYSYLSNGSSFFKNSQVSRQFLKDCYELQIPYLKNINVQVFDHEQQSMRALVLNDPIYKQKTKLIDERVCNSYCTTTNHSVLGAYPNWNTEPNLYQEGDFVIQFCGRTFDERLVIFEEYSKKVKNIKKNVAIIGSFANTEKKVNALKKCIEQCKKMYLDTILVSNFEDSDEIKNSVKYYIHDADNTLLPKHRSPVKWFADSKETIHIHNKGNSYICCKNMYTGINFCKNKYDNFLYLDYDNIILEEDFIKVNKLFQTLDDHGAWVCNVNSGGDEYYETTIYAGNVNFFNTKVNLAKSIDEWNSIPPYSHTTETLERIFPILLRENKDKVYFTNMFAKQYFNKSKIDTFSVFSSANIAYNTEDKRFPIVFVITSEGNYTISINDSIVYEKYHSGGNWIKYPIQITEKNTNVKVKFGEETLINYDLNLTNVEELKEHCRRMKL